MRQQSKVKVPVRNVVIGGDKPLICLPLVAKTTAELLAEAEMLVSLSPDMLEWRIDAFTKVDDLAECLDAQKKLRAVIGDIPLIYTCRIDLEGGMAKMDQGYRKTLIEAAISEGSIDLVDIELCNEEDFISSIKNKTQECGVKLILSYHHFT